MVVSIYLADQKGTLINSNELKNLPNINETKLYRNNILYDYEAAENMYFIGDVLINFGIRSKIKELTNEYRTDDSQNLWICFICFLDSHLAFCTNHEWSIYINNILFLFALKNELIKFYIYNEKNLLARYENIERRLSFINYIIKDIDNSFRIKLEI